MGTGYLKVQARTGEETQPVAGAHVVVMDDRGQYQFEAYTDAGGETGLLALPAPDKALTLNPGYGLPAYSVWNVEVSAQGYVTEHIRGVEVLDTQTSLLPVRMEPPTQPGEDDEYIEIPPTGLLIPDQGQPGGDTPEPEGLAMGRVLHEVIIPDYITVHLGTPGNTAARNLRVRFPDYIKNVASSEIYSTWPYQALVANIHVIVTFAVNRVYTEWYRSRGYNFDITNSTAYDQYYREGGQVFENISQIVDGIFSVYCRRAGYRNPYFTSFCNGTTATCKGLSQWGTVSLANQGLSALQILHHYYPKDLELVASARIAGIAESYPGTALRQGSRGEAVRTVQAYLNRIRRNYPLIPALTADGIFGPKTEEAVRTFQRIFSLSADGIVGRATWNKISYIYVSVTRLAELDGEGERVGIGSTPPTTLVRQGSRGDLVYELQFILNAIAPYHPTVPYVTEDGIFGAGVRAAVIAFQRTFGLSADGVVGPATWNRLYSAYHGLYPG